MAFGRPEQYIPPFSIGIQMKISVIGAPGCGTALFLGLLYETLVRMSTAEDDVLEVVVNVGPVEAKAFGDLRLDLLSGRWPSPELEQKVSGCSLELAFRNGRASLFRGRGFRKVRLASVPLSERDSRVLRSSGQLRELLSGPTGGSIDRNALSERFRDALESEAFVLLASISGVMSGGTWSVEESDAFLATLMDDVTKDQAKGKGGVAFLVVMTGADRGEADGRQLLEDFYPRTEKTLRKAAGGYHTFVSWLGTVPNAEGHQVPATAVSDGQVQIDHSEEEYRRLVRTIGKMV